MFWKKRDVREPYWWRVVRERMDGLARKGADRLNARAARVPRGVLRRWIVVGLVLWLGVDLGMVLFGRSGSAWSPGLDRVPVVPSRRGFMERDSVLRRELDSLVRVQPGMADTTRGYYFLK